MIRSGVPEDVIQVVHLSPSLTSYAVQHPAVDFVSFTGSVAGGQAVEKAAVEAKGFKGVALEVDFVILSSDGNLQGDRCSLVAKTLPMFAQTPIWTIQSESWWMVRASLCVRKVQHIISNRCNVQLWAKLLCSGGENSSLTFQGQSSNPSTSAFMCTNRYLINSFLRLSRS